MVTVKSNHDNVQSTGLPVGMIRGFTTLHNTLNQNDLEALNLCYIFAPTNVNQRGEKLNEEAEGGRDPLRDTLGEVHRKCGCTHTVYGMCV